MSVRVNPTLTLMNTDPSTDETETFERELADLIATAFGRGAPIEGVWTVTFPVSAAPRWSITIERAESDDDPTYDPTFLE